ncbi:hypothetical protein Glove_13g256 [Diversispora epigaea]|uniref:Uncharacterized protein n=1 Tax=Diversispora epigaea TaxID=1348612 RepID=A0A397JWB8_9GLOM|nr:hypothetical protein Glove_13g256 [Diversispora epigaea]
MRIRELKSVNFLPIVTTHVFDHPVLWKSICLTCRCQGPKVVLGGNIDQPQQQKPTLQDGNDLFTFNDIGNYWNNTPLMKHIHVMIKQLVALRSEVSNLREMLENQAFDPIKTCQDIWNEFIAYITCSPDTGTTEDSHHAFWDMIVVKPLKIGSPKGKRNRNTSLHTSTRKLRPDLPFWCMMLVSQEERKRS